MLSSANEQRSLATTVAFFSRPALPENSSLSGGAYGRANPTVAQKSDAWTKHFGDAELIDISFLIVGSTSTDTGGGSESAQDTLADHNSLVNNAIQLAELRKDCLVVASPRKEHLV